MLFMLAPTDYVEGSYALPTTRAQRDPGVSAPVEIDDGVIEEARRRQRRRRTTGTALGLAAIVLGLAVLLIGAGGGGAPDAAEPAWQGPLKVTLVRGRPFADGKPALIGVTQSWQAGNVGVCVRVISGESCNGRYPSRADPVYGGSGGFSPEREVGPGGEIDALFTGPGVAAVRVAHVGSFRAETLPGLPPGAKEVVFFRPPGSRGTVLAPGLGPRVLQSGFPGVHYGPADTETLLDAAGDPIPVHVPPVFTLPNSYWTGPHPPPTSGRCALGSSLAGTRTEWGEVATRIAGDPDMTARGWLSCLDEWLNAGGGSYEAAILLDGRSPGVAPAMLWGAIPVAGHPGMVQIPSVQRVIHYFFPRPSHAVLARELARDTRTVGRARAKQLVGQVERLAGREQTAWDVFTPSTVARRVGPAWVLVRYGASFAQRVRFLEALRVTRLALPHRQAHGRVPGV